MPLRQITHCQVSDSINQIRQILDTDLWDLKQENDCSIKMRSRYHNHDYDHFCRSISGEAYGPSPDSTFWYTTFRKDVRASVAHMLTQVCPRNFSRVSFLWGLPNLGKGGPLWGSLCS